MPPALAPDPERLDSYLICATPRTGSSLRTRFVRLRRGGDVAQAVSLLRAEQTGVWFETAGERQEPAAEPGFDFGQARDLVRQIGDIQPCLVLYEDLDDDPVGIASGVLGFLGLDLLREARERQGMPSGAGAGAGGCGG